MFSKKFALLVLTMFLAFGVNAMPVSAAAKDDVTVENTTKTTNVSDDNNTVTPDTEDVQDTNAVLNTETNQPSSTNTNTIIQNKNSATTIKNLPAKKATPKAKKSKKKKAKYTKKQLRLMASIINCEAGGESMQGKLAVGVVIMNRVKSKAFPNTIQKVIYQKGQFSPVRNGALKKRLRQYDAGKTRSKQWRACILAAKKVLQGQRTVVIKGKVKNMKGYHFFSVRLPHARIKIGGHRFK